MRSTKIQVSYHWNPSRILNHHNVFISLISLLSLTALSAPQNTTSSPKRGLVDTFNHASHDPTLFTAANSTLTWFYNYYYLPTIRRTPLTYVPMIHGLSTLSASLPAIRSLDASVTHLLTFNEPDGSAESGGSNISAPDAAEAYISSILPLRDSHGLKISLPATTGSGRGMDWLADFNASCFSLNPDVGCPADFAAVHWYGDFGGMASYLGQFHEMYPQLPLWLTEFALPAASANVTGEMMRQSLAFLDGLEWVERYSWFGAFRPVDANAFTGDGVSLVGDGGGLSELGVMYLGGEGSGYYVGQTSGAGSSAVPGVPGMGGLKERLKVLEVVFGLVVWVMWFIA
ncbi:glycoside hydrolase family 128 protein [Aulographum hederae CBS 113979]|uniref:Glycoside hydrolase family 128 protein n=1 Tax=Aulographum hederae CBS 113979 TaxID=1176131 RepID=A0A6G1GRU6_9PEZI|nr:glycoside hydrolase family 128 protein [Aulographum hederae CBS 113979]